MATLIGQTVSHYKILERLGGGGMGIVYKAEDTKLERTVALKFLPPEFTRDPDAKTRFVHEARAASALQHSNICTIHEIDETDDGQMYICMDFYNGETLKKKIERGPLSIDQAIDFALQIAQGLVVAHEGGEIHRDIKPANIMITERGEVKIVDFGLARLAGQTRLTINGKTLGTVAYMSPEQARGEEVDHRTDIWSLGVVLYEMLIGQLPFRSEYEQGIIYSILNEQPVPPGELRKDLPPELDRIVLKSLSKNPAERYQYVNELAVDLHRIEKRYDSISRLSENTHEKVLPSKPRHNYIRLLAGMLLAGIVVIAAYFILSGIFNRETVEEIKSIAVLPFDDLSPDKDQEYFCDGMTEQITTNLSQLQKLRVRGRNSVMHFKNTNKTIPQIAMELNVDYVMEGSIRKVANRVRVTVQLIKADDDYHIWANDYDRETGDILNVQDDIAKTVTGILLTKLSGEEEEKIKTKRPTHTEAYEYYLKGKYYHGTKFMASSNMDDFSTAEKMLLKAIEIDTHYAPAYTELADLYNTYYNTTGITDEERDKSLKLQEHYLQIAFSLDSNSADVNRVMGSIYLAKGEKEKAYQHLKKSVELDVNNLANNLEFGIFLRNRGLHYLAKKYYVRAIEIDPLSLRGYFRVANHYWKIGQFNEAEIYFKKALEIDANDVYTLYYYALLLYDMKRYDQFKEISLKHERVNSDSAYITFLQSLQYAVSNEKEKAFKTYSESNRSVKPDFVLMRLYNHFGMYDEFIHYLNEDLARVMKIEESWYLWFNNDPLFTSLRPYTRFHEILEKHKQLYERNLQKYKDEDRRLVFSVFTRPETLQEVTVKAGSTFNGIA